MPNGHDSVFESVQPCDITPEGKIKEWIKETLKPIEDKLFDLHKRIEVIEKKKSNER